MKTSAAIEQQVFAVIRIFLRGIRPEGALPTLNAHASLERDLSIASLEKAELFHRLEREFKIKLPETSLAEVDTLADLCAAIQQAKPAQKKLNLKFKGNLPESTIDPSAATTLIDVLSKYVEKEPKRPHIYLQDEYGSETILSYQELWEAASNIAQGISALGLRPNETVAIMLPTSKAFFFAFIGTLLANCVPVPIYPPFRANQLEEYAKRETFILNNAEVRLLITFAQAERLSKLLKAFVPSLIKVSTIVDLKNSNLTHPARVIHASDPALIQYTSGSTGNPKGVLLSHHNLITNVRAFGAAIAIKPSDIVVSWLPLYHDMGLIGAWLGTLYHGIPLILTSPLTFLARPESWLWNIHYHRATISVGPNFSYELCLKKIEDADIEGLDLSSWRLALNGAEAIYPETLRRFYQRFSRYGLKKETLLPVYGLAECTVALTFPDINHTFHIDKIAYEPFVTAQKAVPLNKKEKRWREFVACGKPLPDHQIRIVDQTNHVLPERMVGEIQFKGPSAMQGYYANPKATAATYHDGWWDTGDLGYLANEALYITGRKKDLIIKAGRNYSPEEIEEVVNLIPSVRKGCVIAFGVYDEQTGTEKIVVVAETTPHPIKNKSQLIHTINTRISAQIGLPPDDVVLVEPRTILKTSSGKLRRSALKERYLKQKIGKPRLPTWIQAAKLLFSSGFKRLISLIKTLGKTCYGTYAIGILLLTLFPCWLLVMITPQRLGSIITRVWAKNYLRLVACPIRIKEAKRLKNASYPAIFVVNHASYIDALVLLALLKTNLCIIGKKELLRVPLLRSLMQKLGHITIDRLDFTQNKTDSERIKSCLKANRSVLLFPEGTFTYAAGVRPFKLGAFLLAVQTQSPLFPIALAGTRKILRSKGLPQPGKITVTFLEQLKPQASTWEEANRLRHLARLAITKYSGEQALDLMNVALPSKVER